MFYLGSEVEESTERQLFLTYASLTDSAEKLEKRHGLLHKTLEEKNSAELDGVEQLYVKH